MHHVQRIVRSFVLGLIMFFSVRGLGFSPAQASVAAMIPFLLGAVDVMAGTAFSLAGTVFIFAVLAHVFPTQYATIQALTATVWQQAGGEIMSSPAPGTTGSGAQTAAATPLPAGSGIVSGTTGLPPGKTMPSAPVPAGVKGFAAVTGTESAKQ